MFLLSLISIPLVGMITILLFSSSNPQIHKIDSVYVEPSFTEHCILTDPKQSSTDAYLE